MSPRHHHGREIVVRTGKFHPRCWRGSVPRPSARKAKRPLTSRERYSETPRIIDRAEHGIGHDPLGRIAIVEQPTHRLRSAATRRSSTVIVVLFATPNAAPFAPTLTVAVATPLPPPLNPYCVPTPVLSSIGSDTPVQPGRQPPRNPTAAVSSVDVANPTGPGCPGAQEHNPYSMWSPVPLRLQRFAQRPCPRAAPRARPTGHCRIPP